MTSMYDGLETSNYDKRCWLLFAALLHLPSAVRFISDKLDMRALTPGTDIVAKMSDCGANKDTV